MYIRSLKVNVTYLSCFVTEVFDCVGEDRRGPVVRVCLPRQGHASVGDVSDVWL